jgi:molybdopterin-guanine dinucleotide biosynthesis protein A
VSIERPVTGVILAGGLARRMGGGDKPLRLVGNRTILDRVIDCVAPQVRALIINANGDASRFSQWPLQVVPDSIEGFAGPLAGVLAALDWSAAHRPDLTHVMSVAADCPFLPGDLAIRLWDAMTTHGARLAVAASAGQAHPVIGLWDVSLREELRRALVEENLRKIDKWTARYPLVEVTWSAALIDPFFNANTPEDIELAERLIGEEEE